MTRSRRAVRERLVAGLSVFGWEVAVVAAVAGLAVAVSLIVLALT
jgi:hypothetical protein